MHRLGRPVVDAHRGLVLKENGALIGDCGPVWQTAEEGGPPGSKSATTFITRSPRSASVMRFRSSARKTWPRGVWRRKTGSGSTGWSSGAATKPAS